MNHNGFCFVQKDSEVSLRGEFLFSLLDFILPAYSNVPASLYLSVFLFFVTWLNLLIFIFVQALQNPTEEEEETADPDWDVVEEDGEEEWDPSGDAASGSKKRKKSNSGPNKKKGGANKVGARGGKKATGSPPKKKVCPIKRNCRRIRILLTFKCVVLHSFSESQEVAKQGKRVK